MKTYVYGNIRRDAGGIIENALVNIYNGMTMESNPTNLVYSPGYTGIASTGSITYYDGV